ncbi:Leucine-rich repeat protein kinase family protein [Hirschfeldia incana]|nr:Leucine-rich repeat protein kinase family protein [Hirschfeldia incana]
MWNYYNQTDWKQISTSLTVNTNSNSFRLPQDSLKTAVTPKNASEAFIDIEYPEFSIDKVYIYLHFAESETIHNQSPVTCENRNCIIKLTRTGKSTHPPLLNAVEGFAVAEFRQSKTDANDEEEISGDDCCIGSFSRGGGDRIAIIHTEVTPRANFTSSIISEATIETQKRRYSHAEVMEMTTNFKRALGEGGFGVVYHGYLNGSQQVAVKVLSESSSQGYKHFKAEVELLLRVHHINLVNLVGYCDERDHLALIYEYMSNGDLKDHLSGKRGGSVLSWSTRLRIAVDAALGLEYLHIGCQPSIVHRDVKCTNILLGEQFSGKIADFGLSRSFQLGDESHVSTVVAGTPGYLDPETGRLAETSDVYSFGIVLLEIITNQRVIDQTREKPHITEWMAFMLNRGDITRIMDPKLHGDFNPRSVWRAIELAMLCANPSSVKRPSMSQVVIELKECLASENSTNSKNHDTNSHSSFEMSMSFDTKAVPNAR